MSDLQVGPKTLRCILFLMLILFSGQVMAQEESKETQVIKEDVLVFRVQTRQVFLGNLKTYLSHLENFHCLFPDSRLLNLAQVKYSQAMALENQTVSQAQENPEVLEGLMRVVLAQVYSNSLSLSLERDFDLALALDKCGLKRFVSWDNELKSLVQAELYLRHGNERPQSINKAARKRYYQNIDEKMEYEFYL